MAQRVENLLRQALPFQHRQADSSMKFRFLQEHEVIIMADGRITQYLTDLQTAGHITITDSSAAPTTGFA